MARPLFEIAQEISADWQSPSPQAKNYIKGMYYLLGMDDYVADLTASTAVRMFLLYSKEWTGGVAERVKGELQEMRTRRGPTNADLLAQQDYPTSVVTIDGCDLCDAPLGSPGKFVEGYSQWNQRARMCMHCNYFLAQGLDRGDGALYLQQADRSWLRLHGEPKVLPSKIRRDPAVPRAAAIVNQPNMRLLVRKIIRRTGKKCLGMVRNLFRKVG